MASGGGGDDDDVTRPQAQESSMGQRRRHQAALLLPLSVVVEIAARSDPVTLVRCAATCSGLRGRLADPGFRRRLRRRHADRFVPSLLRGHLIGDRCYSLKNEAKEEQVYLVDATAAGATVEVRSVAESFPPGPDGEPLALQGALSARDGLVLVQRAHELRVFNLATGRSQTVPPGPGPEFTDCCHHVLLVGDGEGGAVGRPFRVVVAHLALEQKHSRRLLVQTFSSELGTWGPCTEIRTPQIQGRIREHDAPHFHAPGELPRANNALRRGPLVVGGAVHWLCLTESAGYVLKLRVGRATAAAAPRLTVSKLPESFPYNGGGHVKHLLVTMEAGGSPAVLVADGEKISAWAQSKHTSSWNRQPQVVIEYETISRLLDSVGDGRRMQESPREQVKLEWFAERSGIVLILARDYHFLWLDLQSKKIVGWSSDPRIRYKTIYHPCEMGLATWAPTFSSSL